MLKAPTHRSVSTALRPERHLTVPVLLIAAALRLMVVCFVATHCQPQWFFSRGMEMGLLAKALLHGDGLSSPFGPPTGPTAFIAPVYPILVAAVFRMLGADSAASAVVLMLLQTALNLATIACMMHIARRLFSRRAANLAGLAWAISPPLWWMPTIFWETSLSAFLLVGLLTMTWHFAAAPRRSMGCLLGACAAFAVLVNPALLLSVVAIVAWAARQWRYSSKAQPVLAMLTFALLFSPWPVRNARTFHAFIPLRTTVGFELWMGNHPGSTGYLDESLFPTFNSGELASYKAMGELAYTRQKSSLAWRYIAQHPATFLQLTLLRTYRFWTGTGNSNGSAIFALHAILTTTLGLAGLWLLWHRKRFSTFWLWAVPLALFPLPYMITHAEFRYRLVLDPLLTILGSYAATEWIARRPSTRTARPTP